MPVVSPPSNTLVMFSAINIIISMDIDDDMMDDTDSQNQLLVELNIF
jgi:hypothetical protein